MWVFWLKYSPNCLLSDFYICISWRNLKNDCRVSLYYHVMPRGERGNTKKHRPLFYHSGPLRDCARVATVRRRHKHKHEYDERQRRNETRRESRDKTRRAAAALLCCCTGVRVNRPAWRAHNWVLTTWDEASTRGSSSDSSADCRRQQQHQLGDKATKHTHTRCALLCALSVLKRADWTEVSV